VVVFAKRAGEMQEPCLYMVDAERVVVCFSNSSGSVD
jgi:hypothetical protein